MTNELCELTHNILRIALNKNMLSFSIQMDIIRLHMEVKGLPQSLQWIVLLTPRQFLVRLFIWASIYQLARVSSLVNSWLYFTFLWSGERWSKDKK